MQILEQEIKKSSLKSSKNVLEDGMVKAVVDVEREIIGLDAEMHADIERALLERGSSQDALWGINLWFDETGDNFIEFDSMINVRPRQNNRSRDVEDEKTREKIKQVVKKWVK